MRDIMRLLETKNVIRFIEMNLIKIVVSIVIFSLSKYLKKYFDRILKMTFKKSGMDESISTFLRSLFSVFYYAIITYILIGFFGINMTSIAAFIGTAGLVFGLAFKETLANFSGGIIILTFKPFKVGDLIEFKDYIGEVKSIELFYTKLKNPQNELVIVPNGIITNNELRNMTKEAVRRLDLKIGVSYKSDVRHSREVLRDIVYGLMEGKTYNSEGIYILSDPEPVIGVWDLGSSSVIFNVNVYVKTDHYVRMRHILNEEIKVRLDKENIEIPFPQMDVHLKNN